MKYRLLALLMMIACIAKSQTVMQKGFWRYALQLNDSTELPFMMDVKEKTMDIINAEEKIFVDEINYSGDSVFIKMPVFDSEFRGKISGDKISGNFLNHARRDKNVIPFVATHESFRFKDSLTPPTFNMTGRWDVVFAGDAPPLNHSVGEFKQHDHLLAGTFLTSIGDYRYLEGIVTGSTFKLFCFDGSHLYLFTGNYTTDGTITGHYYSGVHWHDTWKAERNENATLPDADSLTFLKSGYDKISFTFPDTDSNLVSLSDKKFQNKIVIVQIMGTWCPNCMDETAFLAPFYKKYKEKGVEIIALDFERINEFPTAKKNLQRLKKRYDIDYTLLYAGSNDQRLRVKALPMLNNILSFPTTIVLDGDHKVRKIHTGFSGPATGEHFEKWKAEFTEFVDKLVSR